jgi:hypothetical protein
MAMSGKQLLAFADRILALTHEQFTKGDRLDSAGLNACANVAQACVMLAKELRESEKEVD